MDGVKSRRNGLRIWKILKKIQLRSDRSVEKLGFDQAVESWHWIMKVESWILYHGGREVEFYTIEADSCRWDFEVGSWKRIVDFLPLEQRVRFRPLKDVASIVWYEILLRIVSFLVSKNRIQKLINRSYLNNGVACVFVSACMYLHMYCITVVIDITKLYNNTFHKDIHPKLNVIAQLEFEPVYYGVVVNYLCH